MYLPNPKLQEECLGIMKCIVSNWQSDKKAVVWESLAYEQLQTLLI